MSVTKPAPGDFDAFDVWKLVSSRRQFEGQIPLAAFSRLQDLLTAPDTVQALDQPPYVVDYRLDFGVDELKVPSVRLSAQVALPLLCQRSLQSFDYPVQVEQTIGLLRDEADEAALPTGYEALLLPDDGKIRPLELIEDELIMAIPLVPTAPGTEMMEQEWTPPASETAAANPFAALGSLKKS